MSSIARGLLMAGLIRTVAASSVYSIVSNMLRQLPQNMTTLHCRSSLNGEDAAEPCVPIAAADKDKLRCHMTVESQRNSPRALWSTVRNLLGSGGSASYDDIGAVNFHDFFDQKVADVRASTSDAPLSSYSAQ